jgi:nucleotide-binding universal stress UspA family protein
MYVNAVDLPFIHYAGNKELPVKDILLQITSYPDPTSSEAIDQAVQFARFYQASLSALAVQVEFKAPGNWLAERLINLSALCAEQESKSLAHCRSALADFTQKVSTYNIAGDALMVRASLDAIGEHVAYNARTRDLCLIPAIDVNDGQRTIAEAVAFESGRPALLYRPGAANLPSQGFGTAVVAWDGTRSAARAMGDALPLLRTAREVRVLTVVNEKESATSGIGDDAVRHLKIHQVNALSDEVDAGGRKVGEVLSDYVVKHGSDLLVMGAYGRSRLREFLLGGATDYMLQDQRVPLFFSH